MQYRVWLHGSSMTASYDGYVDVFADNSDDAEDRALNKLTGRNGTFSDWHRRMFKVDKVEERSEY